MATAMLMQQSPAQGGGGTSNKATTAFQIQYFLLPGRLLALAHLLVVVSFLLPPQPPTQPTTMALPGFHYHHIRATIGPSMIAIFLLSQLFL
jgi:hypothetical protein